VEDYIPKDGINTVTQLWTTILERWLSHFMFTKTILRTPIRGGTQHATSFATRIVDPCVQWLQLGGQAAQWASAMAEICSARISAPSYRIKGDELIIQNAKHTKKLVQCGRAGYIARALMSCDVAELCNRTFGKLLTKL
jgi:hypothetical protein